MIEVGWVNADGTETLCDDFDNSTPVEAALELVGKINSCMSDECWFVMAGPDRCPKACSDCGGAMHHWQEVHDNNDDTIKLMCKHCVAWRTPTDRDE